MIIQGKFDEVPLPGLLDAKQSFGVFKTKTFEYLLQCGKASQFASAWFREGSDVKGTATFTPPRLLELPHLSKF